MAALAALTSSAYGVIGDTPEQFSARLTEVTVEGRTIIGFAKGTRQPVIVIGEFVNGTVQTEAFLWTVDAQYQDAKTVAKTYGMNLDKIRPQRADNGDTFWMRGDNRLVVGLSRVRQYNRVAVYVATEVGLNSQKTDKAAAAPQAK